MSEVLESLFLMPLCHLCWSSWQHRWRSGIKKSLSSTSDKNVIQGFLASASNGQQFPAANSRAPCSIACADSSQAGTDVDWTNEPGISQSCQNLKCLKATVALFATLPSAQIVEWHVRKDICNKTIRSLVQFPLMPPVCVAHQVIAWELGWANRSDLGTENSQQGEIGLKDAAWTRGLQFCQKCCTDGWVA